MFDYFDQYACDKSVIEHSLSNFRTDFVWKNDINDLYFNNLQGLMTLFNKYRQVEGMTSKNAIKLCEDAKLKVNPDELQ